MIQCEALPSHRRLAIGGETADSGAIEELFSARFERWSIALPRESLEERSGGHLFEHGWHIGYSWGEESGEAFLQVLAQNRMTNDRHFKIYASGRVEDLPAPLGMYVTPAGASEEEIARIRDESIERDRQLYAELRERGLLPPEGQNLAAHEVNEYLRSGEPREDSSD